MTNTLTIDQLQ
ncbi:dUTP diphosphatase, partial [Staphylococcus aureus subsp. aureus 65-1322]